MSESYLKKFLFKAARTNKLEILNQFIEDIDGNVPSLLECKSIWNTIKLTLFISDITKKDP